MATNNNIHAEIATPSFEAKVVPIHQSEGGGPLSSNAHREILARDQHTEAALRVEADIAHLQELRDEPPRRNIFKRRQQRRALNEWLNRKGYDTADEAHDRLSAQHTQMTENANDSRELLEELWFPKIRQELGNLRPDLQQRADKLFRANNFPGGIAEICEDQATATGQDPNLLVWLSQTPSTENPFGATNEELESILLWNASCTERMAADPEGAAHMVANNLVTINQRVKEGKLDESWANPLPDISHIIIGDIMNTRYLGYGEASRGGEYDRRDRTLTLWPYELEDESNIAHVFNHECNHALGSFDQGWLDEAATEAFTLILDDEDPFKQSTTYNVNRQGLKKLLEGAGASCKDASKFYRGGNAVDNEARFGEFLKERYDGLDVLHTIKNAYQESFGGDELQLRDPVVDQDASFVAACTAATIADSFDEARHNAHAIAQEIKELYSSTDSDLQRIAYKHAYGLFMVMADQQAARAA